MGDTDSPFGGMGIFEGNEVVNGRHLWQLAGRLGPIGSVDDVDLANNIFDRVDVEGIPEQIDKLGRQGVKL